jgi:hypothetical protein
LTREVITPQARGASVRALALFAALALLAPGAAALQRPPLGPTGCGHEVTLHYEWVSVEDVRVYYPAGVESARVKCVLLGDDVVDVGLP